MWRVGFRGIGLMSAAAASAGAVSAFSAAAPAPDPAGLVGFAPVVTAPMSDRGRGGERGCPPGASYNFATIGREGTGGEPVTATATSAGFGLASGTAEIELDWTDDASVGDPSLLHEVTANMLLTTPDGGSGGIQMWTGDYPRPGCSGPTNPVTETSPLGPALAVRWAATIDGKGFFDGCGYVAVQTVGSNMVARFLITSSAGVVRDDLPDFACSTGQAVPKLVTPSAGFAIDKSLSRAAAVIAHKRVTVSCATNKGAWDKDFAYGPGSSATIAGSSLGYVDVYWCRGIRLNPNTMTAKAIAGFAAGSLVLAHMAEEMRGIGDVDKAECAALRDLPKLDRALGVTNKRVVAKLLATARKEQYYVDGHC